MLVELTSTKKYHLSQWFFILFAFGLLGFYYVEWVLQYDKTDNFYTIVAPRFVRPNSEYHAAVSIHGTAEPTTVVLEVVGTQDSGGSYKSSQFITVQPYVTGIIKLDIQDIGPGLYNLTARGDGGLRFYNTTQLIYSPKSNSVFIQTDKAIYKPGQKVQFRILSLSSQLRPSVTNSLNIHVTDGHSNRVKQWTDVRTTKGVYSGEMQLSEWPVLGDWNIIVKIAGQTYSKGFQVAEYVLPKFEVTIDVAEHATFKDSIIAGVVRAKYTYGRPVKGEATVTIYPAYHSEILQPVFNSPFRKIFPIDGKASIEFDIVKDLSLKSVDYKRIIQVDVTVEEALTGRRQNTTTQITVNKHKYEMELIKTSEHFKPGLKYTAFLKLAHHDGTPVIDKTNSVKVRSGFSYSQEEYNETTYKLTDNGLIELTFFPPMNVSTIGIEAFYLDITEWFSTVSAAVSPSNSFIQAIVRTPKPKVNQDIEIEVNSTHPLKYISYEILGRGDIIMAHTVHVTGNLKSANWRFVATYAMAPVAHIVCQYVREDGEVVADALDIELEGVMQNFVNIQTSTEETTPGGDVELKIDAKPNSYVGLLGVDQSVLLLKTGNDLSYNDVLSDLKSYDGGNQPTYGRPYGFLDRMKRSFYWPGSFTAHQTFENSGAVIMTNGFVYEYTPWLHWRSGNFGPDVAEAGVAYGAAFSSAGMLPMIESSIKVRSKFPETWLWQMIDAGFDGKASIRKQMPDTITSWVISAFSIDSLYGLGLIDEPRKIKVFRPFFVSLDLPYSIIRGETMAIPIIVFNYMNKALTADITIENTEDAFEFADYSNEINAQPKVEYYRRKTIEIAPDSGTSTSFMITPKKIGYISIKITAKSDLAGDAVERKLLVKAEGETQYRNKAIFVDLRSSNTFRTNVTLDIPKNVVEDSEYIEVAAVGDILGPAIPNLEHLIKMPFGCGEQNMLNFVPNIVILDYLKNSQQITSGIESKCLKYMETGYQRELTYRHLDGSFSAFGDTDPSGSTWLTAFVIKSFRQAMRHIDVEDKIILDGLRWLSQNQANNGSFPEVGQVSHTDMQGGSGKGIALTAYTLTAFIENRGLTQEYVNTINKAIDFIARNYNGINDIYALMISTYALHLADHPMKEAAFRVLESKAHNKDEMKWWKRASREDDDKNPNAWQPNSVDVEMTAYGMLIYLHRGLVQDTIPIMKWLISQQNDQGGFASTQDTVVALAALSRLAEIITSKSQDVTTTFSYGKGISTDIRVNSNNAMIIQNKQIPGKVRELNITASGRGFAIVQVSYRYNVNVTGAWPLFTLDPQVDKNSNKNHLQLSVCSGFVGTRDHNETNMAVMEVSLPSGFTVDQDTLPSLQMSQHVKKVETKEGDTVVVMYFDKMTKQEYCPTVSAFRTHKVAKQKPAPVVVYDYYDQSRRARVFYEPLVATECDLCEGEDCVCNGSFGSQFGNVPDSARINRISTIFVYLVPVLFLLN